MAEQKTKILLVEDDQGLSTQLKWALAGDYAVFTAKDRKSALELFRREEMPLVILDLGLPPDPNGASEGLSTLKEILAVNPLTKIVISSGNNQREHALAAIDFGAYDFYPKPVDIDILQLILSRALSVFELETENKRLSQLQGMNGNNLGIIGSSPEIIKVCSIAEKVAKADVSIMIRGESGTGKEVFANAIHRTSNRAQKPFVALNCAAIPDNLLESEIFGHEKGAFTGAVKQTIGKIEMAQGGTLFLDEIGDMPANLQPKLLRFLQERCFERIGGRSTISVDVRVISATNQKLEEMMQTGEFREDLFFRLNEIPLDLPPLRDREGDIIMLANYFISHFAQEFQKKITGLLPEAEQAMMRYSWPGNVRELEAKIKRAVLLADDKKLSVADLDLSEDKEQIAFPTLRTVRENAERKAILSAISLSGNNISKAARLLGITRPTLYELMNTLGLRE